MPLLRDVQPTATPQPLVICQNTLGECPLWDHPTGHLYWIDILEGRVFRLHWASRGIDEFALGTEIGCIAIRAAGGFVVATRLGIGFWEPGKAVEYIHRPEATLRFNDGAVDPEGRFWVGTFSLNPEGRLYRMDTDHSLHVVEQGVAISNGIRWPRGAALGQAMLYTDSKDRMIYRYDFDPPTGAISGRRPWLADMEHGEPDGMALDAEGHLWSAHWGGGKLIRYDPQGRKSGELPVPVEQPSSVCFGGPELDLMFITSARKGLSTEALAAHPHAGDLMVCRPGVRGLAEYLFLG